MYSIMNVYKKLYIPPWKNFIYATRGEISHWIATAKKAFTQKTVPYE